MDAVAVVEKRTHQEIESTASLLRELLGLTPLEPVPMARLIELALPRVFDDFELHVLEDAEMPGVEASVHSTRMQMYMSETTYGALLNDQARARFTAAHEVGHIILHCGEHVRYARLARLADEVNPEWQADVFAAALLMPEKGFRACKSIEEAQAVFGVGFRAASKRAKTLKHKWKQKTGNRRQPASRL